MEIITVKFAGRSWESKIASLRRSLTDAGHDATVLTALDEIAWLFNLRGKDIPLNPVFRAYAIVSEDKAILYLEPGKQTQDVKDHLNAEVTDFLSEIL